MVERAAPFRPDAPTAAELAAGGIVRRVRGRELLLLHQRSDDRWCLPKGHTEAGETLGTTALREIEEETGLSDLRLGRELLEVHYRYFDPTKARNVLKVVVYFDVRAGPGEPRLEDGFDRFAWLPATAARRRLPFATDRRAVDALARRRS
jgi:8-oxo-(d)GTP phosphatase